MNGNVELSSFVCKSVDIGLHSSLNEKSLSVFLFMKNRFNTYTKSSNVFIEFVSPAVCR
jgi:hypothetical protein